MVVAVVVVVVVTVEILLFVPVIVVVDVEACTKPGVTVFTFVNVLLLLLFGGVVVTLFCEFATLL